jgi:hypothetical protein
MTSPSARTSYWSLAPSSLAVVLGYLFGMTWFIYGELNTGREDTWLLPLVVLAQVALGVGLNRWWAALLPLALVVIAIPAGLPEITPSNAEPFPVFFGVAFGAVFAVPLVLIGVIARQVTAHWLASRVARESPRAPGIVPPAASRR